MFPNRVKLECPFCYWIFEATIPDKRHSTASLEEPQRNGVVGDIIEENHVCRNPKCRKPFIVYWFEPLEFLHRI